MNGIRRGVFFLLEVALLFSLFPAAFAEESSDAKNPDWKLCPSCVRQIEADSNFCRFCGEKVTDEAKELQRKYEEALAIMNNEASLASKETIAEALVLFEELSEAGYKDSSDLLLTVKYLYAAVLMNETQLDMRAIMTQLDELDEAGFDEELLREAVQWCISLGLDFYLREDYAQAKKVFSAFPDKDIYIFCKYYEILCKVHLSESISYSELYLMEDNLEVADTKELLLSGNGIAQAFLRGTWRSTQGHRFIVDDEGIKDGLPKKYASGIYMIQDGVLWAGTSKEPMYSREEEIEIIDCNTIQVRCDSNEKTYTLNRTAN